MDGPKQKAYKVILLMLDNNNTQSERESAQIYRND